MGNFVTAPSGAMRGSPPEPAAASASTVFCSSFFCLSKTNPVCWTYCSVTHWAEVLDPTPLPLPKTKCLTSSLLPALFNINAPWKKKQPSSCITKPHRKWSLGVIQHFAASHSEAWAPWQVLSFLQASFSHRVLLWSSLLVEKALRCQVGFAYMMRIIACLKFNTFFRGKTWGFFLL